tara:strand:+ start:2220 stop:2798 length:579 start_codon:yes stop_codon:yes gene_type:complete
VINFDLNEVEPVTEAPRREFGIIPHDTIVRGIINIKRGNNVEEDPCLTKYSSGSVGLEVMWKICDAEDHNMLGQAVWGKFFFTEKTSQRSLGNILRIIEDHYNIAPDDTSEVAKSKRDITKTGLVALEGLEACIRVEVEESEGYPDKNMVWTVLSKKDKGYRAKGGSTAPKASEASQIAQAPATDKNADWMD